MQGGLAAGRKVASPSRCGCCRSRTGERTCQSTSYRKSGIIRNRARILDVACRDIQALRRVDHTQSPYDRLKQPSFRALEQASSAQSGEPCDEPLPLHRHLHRGTFRARLASSTRGISLCSRVPILSVTEGDNATWNRTLGPQNQSVSFLGSREARLDGLQHGVLDSAGSCKAMRPSNSTDHDIAEDRAFHTDNV